MTKVTPEKMIVSIYKAVSLVALLAMASGLLVLAGWALGIPALKSISPDWVSMKANTAACFVLLGFALYSQAFFKQTPPVLKQAGLLAALLAALVGLLTLFEYGLGLNLGIDQLLFVEPVATVGTFAPGRMAPDTALSFLGLGLALAINALKLNRLSLIAATAGLLAAVFALASLFAYLTPVLGAYGWFGFTVMAVHTAWLFLLLGLAVTWLCWQKSATHWSLGKSVTLAVLFA